jgi:ATP-dependent DNA helicase MPH1
MSENREDTNWETAQQTHREIQEEILHSRNLELFEDVERLLPPGPLPKCTEQEMAIDPWDPADQKKKSVLPSATQEQVAKAKATRAKRANGLEIPKGVQDGFRSVSELLKLAGAKKRGRKSAAEKAAEAAAAAAVARLTEEEEEDEDQDEDNSADDAAEHEMLYGSVRSKSSGKRPTPKSTPKRPPAKKVRTSASGKTASQITNEARTRERAELSRQAMDFFNTQSIVRARTPTPTPLTPRSSRTASLGPDIDSEPAAGTRLSPRTAAAAGFSQAIIALSSDDEDDW